MRHTGFTTWDRNAKVAALQRSQKQKYVRGGHGAKIRFFLGRTFYKYDRDQ